MSQTYNDAAVDGMIPDSRTRTLFNRTGAAVTKGYVGVVNDNGTNAAYDDFDGSDTDRERNVIALTTSDIECRAVVAAEDIPAGQAGRWYTKGRCQAMVASQAGDATTVAINSPITLSSHITTGASVSAGQFTSRNKTGSGCLDATTVTLMVFGRTRETTTNTAALKWIDLNCDGDSDGGGG